VISVIGSGVLTRRSDRFLDLVVCLVNRADIDEADERALADVGELLGEFGYDRSGVDASDLATLRFIRAQLRNLLSAPEFTAAARLISSFLERSDARLVLVTDAAGQAELSMTTGDRPVSDAVMADIAVALAALVSRGSLTRLGICGAPGCGTAFYDRSQAGNRRYCDPQTCGNRANVAAYRRRRKRVSS
jgi:predicted RNA-binding Zn ribbon-like protein